MAGRPKRTEEVTSLLLRLPPTLLRKLDRCKALLELREGGSLTRTSVLARALDVGADVLIGEDIDQYGQTRIVSPTRTQPATMQPKMVHQSIPEHEETAIVSEDTLEEALEEDKHQGENMVPNYDTGKYALGKLCPLGHGWGTTGQSLLTLGSRTCKECKNEYTRAKREEQRQAKSARPLP